MGKETPIIIDHFINNGQYVTDLLEKKSIFLHHTSGGSFKSAYSWWNATPDRVGTAFVIERDGTIYRTFDEKYWAYHLGIKGDDDWNEKHSIGIEIVSMGGLTYSHEAKSWVDYKKRTIPSDQVTPFSKGYRSSFGFHSYTQKQIESIIRLIWYLKTKYPSISTSNLKQYPNFWEYNTGVIYNKIPGIWSHTTVRKDKQDIFPQSNLINQLRLNF